MNGRAGRVAEGLVFTVPLAVLAAAAVAAVSESGARVFLDACARATATLASLPTVLVIALTGSIAGLTLWHGSRQARLSREAVRLAARHAVDPPPQVAALARRLGIRRLSVTSLPSNLAYCAGLLRPTVVVSRALVATLTPAALEAVLAHEAVHARRRHPLRQGIAHVLGRALWIVPAAGALADIRRLRFELAADRAAVRRTGRRPLAEALLALHHPVSPPGPATVAGGASLLSLRIDALTGEDTHPRLRLPTGAVVRSLLGVTVVALLALLVAVGPDVRENALTPMPMDAPATLDMAVAWVLRIAAAAGVWTVARMLSRGGSRVPLR
ncbi:MAG: M56 family metallopeptidase [Actinomycetota bacterium]